MHAKPTINVQEFIEKLIYITELPEGVTIGLKDGRILVGSGTTK